VENNSLFKQIAHQFLPVMGSIGFKLSIHQHPKIDDIFMGELALLTTQA